MRGRRSTAHLCQPSAASKLSIKSPTQTHKHPPTNRGYEGEVNLSYGASAERTTVPRVLVRTTWRSLPFAALRLEAFISLSVTSIWKSWSLGVSAEGEERKGREKKRIEKKGKKSIARAQEQRRWERMWNETWDRERKETSGKNRQLKKRNVRDMMKKIGESREDKRWWHDMMGEGYVRWESRTPGWGDALVLSVTLLSQTAPNHLFIIYVSCLFVSVCVSHPKIETPLSLELLSVSFCTKVWPAVSFSQSLSPLIFLVKDLHQLYKIQKEPERK